MISRLQAVARKFDTGITRFFRHGDGISRNSVTGLLVLVILFSAELTVNNAAAQEIVHPDSKGARKLYISRVSPDETTTVQTGQILSGIRVERSTGAGFENSLVSNTTYAFWLLEPAGIARIITPMPVEPLTESVEVEFLRPGTVTLTAHGFDSEEEDDESTLPGFNTAVFTFTVESSSSEEQPPVNGGDTEQRSLSPNARSALAAANQACEAPTSESDTIGLGALRNTCAALALQDDPADDLDRLIPEEFHAIGDALITTADHQITNVQSRIHAVRAGQRDAFDVSSLNLRLWDQTIDGSILGASKDSLWQFYGGNASQDNRIDSALGMFANGNISIGRVNGNDIQRDADITNTSLTVGADYRIDNNRVVGAALGIANDNTDFAGDNGAMDLRGINFSAFGTWYDKDKGYADLIVDVSQNDVDLTRRINLVGQRDEFAQSNTDAVRMSLSINAGRTFYRAATEFGPVARITITRAAIDGFNETSSLLTPVAGTTLDVKSHTVTSARFSVGGEIKHAISTSKAVLVPSARIELENESETVKEAISASFQHDPDQNQLLIDGSKRDNSALLISIGSTAVFANEHSAFVFFETRTQDRFTTHNRVRVGYRVHF